MLPFPITPASLRRKVWRDLSGQTGRKFVRGAWKRSMARWRAGDEHGRRAFVGFLATNGVLFALLAALGHPLLYLLWIGAWLTTNTLVTRIRSIAEHAMVPDPSDPLRNTRTTLAHAGGSDCCSPESRELPPRAPSADDRPALQAAAPAPPCSTRAGCSTAHS